MQRSKLVFPHPDGPINAVIDPWRMSRSTFFSARNSPYQRFRPRV